MDAQSQILQRERIAAPQGRYEDTLEAIAGLVGQLEQAAGRSGLPLGVGHPGAISPATGLMKNSNSTWLNGLYAASGSRAASGPAHPHGQ